MILEQILNHFENSTLTIFSGTSNTIGVRICLPKEPFAQCATIRTTDVLEYLKNNGYDVERCVEENILCNDEILNSNDKTWEFLLKEQHNINQKDNKNGLTFLPTATPKKSNTKKK